MRKTELRVVITTVFLREKHYVSRKRFTKDFAYEFEYTTNVRKALPFDSYLQAVTELKWAEKHHRPHEVETITIELPVMVANSTTLN